MLLPKEEGGTLIIKFLLQAAVILGLFVLTSNGEVAEVDVLITFWLLPGPMPSLNPKSFNPFASWLGLARIFMATATTAYYCWFWFVGWGSLLQPGCAAVAFFGGVSVESPFRLFSAVVVAIGLAVCVTLAAARFIRPNVPDKWWNRTVELEVDRGVEVGLLCVLVLAIMVSIAMVEYLILANRVGSVNDVQSIGQLCSAHGCVVVWRRDQEVSGKSHFNQSG